MDDVQNLVYYTDVYVGSNQQLFSVIVDTGSNKLIIMNSSCTTCHKAKFNVE